MSSRGVLTFDFSVFHMRLKSTTCASKVLHFRMHVQHGLLQTEGQWIILRSTLIPLEMQGTLKSELDIAFY